MAGFKRPQAKRWAESFRYKPYPQPSYRAQNPSRKVQNTPQDLSRPRMQASSSSLTPAEKEDHLKFLYSSCNAGSRSSYHDIKCGHRIYVEYANECGANCLKEGLQNPFVCPECIAGEVRTEMLLKGLSIIKEDDEMDDGTREEKIHNIAHSKIYDLITPASVRFEWNQYKAPTVLHRLCKMVEKFEDPKMQFFDKFLKDEGLEGINAAEEKTKAERKPFHEHFLPKMPNATPVPTTAPAPARPALQTNAWPEEHDDPDTIWCTCRQVDDGDRMVMCDNDNCQYIWYHTRCLTREERPIKGAGHWVCPDCVDVLPPNHAGVAKVVISNSNAMEDITDQMGDVCVGDRVEDDATKAVREALAAFALEEQY
ncbi:hypothetical protein HBI62_069050 [Parastagonospora nodorum]|nr:hypothetical protein HBI62_069050 [Parastagonospora nodorum]KAH6163426.1 hypothetical protein HBI63_039340 [Parastagonospora nodorum]KAH6183681.1 hypothetical protein HBI61_072490 [Parastagonospora nodorum]KAH6197074.1 hypothetical protein HBI53_170110 [Parastagonospora nodorum]